MCVSALSICVFFIGVVAAPLILHLFEYSFNANVCSMVKQLLYFRLLLILCILLNHKVDKGVSILLLSSFNVGCHGITPRFSHVCASTNVCKYIIMSLLIIYLLTFVKVLLLVSN
jgi:hypothetical protein